ncbi:MAG TPA: ABC transporter permease [Blastocatellia bacterium]|nr:ABC transporter permease [Blastocatellia bacterium]
MAILTLALGIGANTAIFSLVNGALLRPPVLGQHERLLRILKRSGGNYFSFPNYQDLAAGTPSFSMLAAHSTGHMIMRRGDSMERVFGEFVTGNFFPAVEVRAALGRTFGTEADDATSASPVVVLSHGLWRRRFGADPGVVSRHHQRNDGETLLAGTSVRPGATSATYGKGPCFRPLPRGCGRR